MASKLQTATDTSVLRIKSIINDYYQFHQIIETAEGCHLWSQGPNSNGYVRLNFKLISSITKTEINPKIGLHEVQCFLKEDNVEKKVAIKGVSDCSHICHNRGCVNPEHIFLEPRTINHSRKKCKKLKFCRRHIDNDGKQKPDCIFN